jgi:hypothetical protein
MATHTVGLTLQTARKLPNPGVLRLVSVRPTAEGRIDVDKQKAPLAPTAETNNAGLEAVYQQQLQKQHRLLVMGSVSILLFLLFGMLILLHLFPIRWGIAGTSFALGIFGLTLHQARLPSNTIKTLLYFGRVQSFCKCGINGIPSDVQSPQVRKGMAVQQAR